MLQSCLLRCLRPASNRTFNWRTKDFVPFTGKRRAHGLDLHQSGPLAVCNGYGRSHPVAHPNQERKPNLVDDTSGACVACTSLQKAFATAEQVKQVALSES
jgi:hypothetical protein